MAKEFKNIKLSAKVTENTAKIDMTIDVMDFIKGEELSISSTGVTYNVASTFGGHKLHEELSGLVIDVKVYTKKEDYDRKRQHIAQQQQAQVALAELAKNKGAQDFFAQMGVPANMQGEVAAGFAAFMAQFASQQGK